MMQRALRLFPWWLWCLPLAIFALSAPLWLHLWEPALFLWINHACSALPAQVWTGLSLFGNGWAVLAVTAPLLVLSPRLMWAWLCAAPFAIVLARLGKSLLESPRPAALVDNTQMRIVGEVMHNVSMPSGHTTTAVAVATAIFLALTPAQRRRHWWVLLLALGTGISRIAVGAHWPGDVAAGVALGLLCGLLGNVLLDHVDMDRLAARRWPTALLAAVIAAAAYVLLTDFLDFEENIPAQRALAALALGSLGAWVWRALQRHR